MNADRRVSTLRRMLDDRGIPALLLTDISNIRYMTGFENVFDDHANVACLVTADIARVYTDFRYVEAADEAAQGSVWVVKSPKENLYIELCSELGNEGIAHVGMESSTPYGRFRFMSEQFVGRVEVIDEWVEQLRQVKEAAEIERIAAAADLTSRCMEYVKTVLTVGRSEREVALDVEVFMRTNGAEAVAFPPIVASGPNSARPHARVSERTLEAGDFVTIDIGAQVNGYCADMTRTFVMGGASDRQREVYEAVREANEAALDAARAGIKGVELDGVARGLLGSKGFGEYFGHGLGHGVGMDVHELPYVSSRGRESLRAGTVVTIEPGVYLEGFGGVRIEDLVVIEEGGCTILSRGSRDLTELR